MNTTIKLIAFHFVLISPLILNAEAPDNGKTEDSHKIKLRSYDPNLVGYQKDSNDVPFMNIRISLMYPLTDAQRPLNLNFAFTGEFAQYLKTRDSSPVIGRRFNPKLFLRYKITPANDIDVGYAHESNGQSINNEADYFSKRGDFASHHEDPNFARDYISRGWDYCEAIWTHRFDNDQYSSDLAIKDFLNHGLLQGDKEEYQSWEGGTGKSRNEVDGISLLMNKNISTEPWHFHKITVSGTTGYTKPLKYNSLKMEASYLLGTLPVMIWAANGYNSDLVDYYRKTTSIGIGFELTTD